MLKRIARGAYRRRKAWSSTALLKGPRKLYGEEALQWKSASQERALTTTESDWPPPQRLIADVENVAFPFMEAFMLDPIKLHWKSPLFSRQGTVPLGRRRTVHVLDLGSPDNGADYFSVPSPNPSRECSN
jgi:hypothetical protein